MLVILKLYTAHPTCLIMPRLAEKDYGETALGPLRSFQNLLGGSRVITNKFLSRLCVLMTYLRAPYIALLIATHASPVMHRLSACNAVRGWLFRR